jgi:TRAP-type transport system periplasmic protein
MGDPYGRRMTRTALISLLVVALLAGCDSGNSDRAGGDEPVEAKVLTMANANFEPGELEAFDKAVEQVSGGRLKLKWRNEYSKGRDGNAEVNVIRDVSAGKVDLGWAGSRVFDELGDRAFNPLHAPLLIDSYELEESVVSDPLVEPMLESLGDLDLQGIGVLPGPLRRPLARRPLRGPGDWTGARISYSGGAQIAASLGSLGAKATYDDPAVTEPTDGLDGIETHLAAVPGNHYHYDFPDLTGNVVLWPRPLVLFAAPDVSADDLAVLRKAAREAIPGTAALSRSMDGDARSELCRASLKVVDASERQVDELRDAFRPVTSRLERDEATRDAVARIEQLSRDSASGVATVRCPEASEPATKATIPPGRYRSVLTRADAKEHGFSWSSVVEEDPDPKALKSKTRSHLLEFTKQGTFLVYDVQLDGTEMIGWEGDYSTYRDRITVQGNDGTKITARLEVDGDTLRFTDVQPGPNTPEALTWGSKPYVGNREPGDGRDRIGQLGVREGGAVVHERGEWSARLADEGDGATLVPRRQLDGPSLLVRPSRAILDAVGKLEARIAESSRQGRAQRVRLVLTTQVDDEPSRRRASPAAPQQVGGQPDGDCDDGSVQRPNGGRAGCRVRQAAQRRQPERASEQRGGDERRAPRAPFDPSDALVAERRDGDDRAHQRQRRPLRASESWD